MIRFAIACGLILLAGFVAHEAIYPQSPNPVRRHVEECPICQCPDSTVWSCVTGQVAADYGR